MRYRFSYSMHGALVRRVACSVDEAVNDSGSFNLSTSCQLPSVIRALFPNTPAHLHLLPDEFKCDCVCLSSHCQELYYLSLSLAFDGMAASAGSWWLLRRHLTWGAMYDARNIAEE